ncbi:MAG: VWA domain-containing protein [Myxococcales bacterium]|nr:VWA domain-containing protein [Myxococcales bacterium]
MTLSSPLHFAVMGQPAGFERPVGLLLAAVVAVVTALVAGRALRRRVIARAWVTAGQEERLVSARLHQRRALRLGVGGAGLALLALAWAGPLLGESQQKVTRRGIDLVVALDASRSMLASDVAPSRLLAARAAVEQLVDRLGGDRVGVVAFARDAFVQAPLTTDYDAARLYLRAVDPLQMQQGGTALAGALEQAGGMFERAAESGRDRAVLLVSDGEDWGGGAVEEAKQLASQGVRVFTLGVGTTQGAPVPVLDARGRLTGYEKDAQGAPVVTRPNPQALAAIAAAGNGEAFFQSGRVDEAPVAQRLDRLQKGDLGAGTRVAGVLRYQWLALPGVLLLALALALAEAKPGRRATAPAPGSAVAVSAALAVALLAPPAHAAGWFDSPEPHVNEGLAAYAKGDFAGAASSFDQVKRKDGRPPAVAAFDRGVALYKAGKKEEAVAALKDARSPELQGRDAYNTGLALAALEKKEEAIHEFRSALEMDPQNEDARHNLEVLLAKKQDQQQDKEQNEQQDQQQDKQQSKQDQQQGKQDQQQGKQDQQQSKQDQRQNKQEQQSGQQREPQKSQTSSEPQKEQQGAGEQQKEGPQPGEAPRAAGKSREPRTDAERALDQLKRGERLLPLGQPTTPPPEDESDEHTW